MEVRGDQSTGWSMAWKINFWARLQDGDHAYKLLGDLLRPCVDEHTKEVKEEALILICFVPILLSRLMVILEEQPVLRRC